MIVQCDQCSTRFKLDDAKIKESGTKVRCSKCKQVFVVKKEAPQEEADFDSILSGLGTQVAPAAEGGAAKPVEEVAAAVAPPPMAPAEDLPVVAAATPPAAADEFDFNFADPEPAQAAETVPPKVSSPVAEAPPATDEFDLSAFSFGEETVAAEPPAAAPASQQQPAEFDSSEFSFGEEPATETGRAAVPAATDEFDAGDFTFAEAPAAAASAELPPASAATADFDAESFSFGEVPLGAEPEMAVAEAKPADAVQSEADGFGNNEFSFEDEPLAVIDQPAAAAAVNEQEAMPLDFGELAPDATAKTEPPLQDGGEDLFSFETDVAAAPTGGGNEPLDFGTLATADISAGEQGSITAADLSSSFVMDDFNPAPADQPPPLFDTEMTANDNHEELFADIAAEPSFGNDTVDFSSSATASDPASAESIATDKGGQEMEPLDFGALDFGETAPAKPSPPAVVWGDDAEKADNAATGAVVAGAAAVATAAAVAAAAGAKGGAAAAGSTPIPAPEDEMPPLSITSRRKGASALPIALTAIVAVIILALAGVGFFLFKGEQLPASLGFVSKWLGKEQKEIEKITIRNPVGEFHNNKEAGELFVVTGEAVNGFKKARASIQVKVVLFGAKGEVVQQKIAYCGNSLTKEQLQTLPLAKIDAVMNNQFGDSLANMSVQPGKGIPFVVVFNAPPKDAAEFGIEVSGSTVASQ